jgi:di/tripeptidase
MSALAQNGKHTMDGSQIGELEYENFNAAGVKNYL